MTLTRRHLATAAVGVGAAAAIGWLALGPSGAKATAPEVTYTLLNGSKTTTSAMKGQVVLVNFWATSCSTCVGEMPQIVSTYEKFKARGYQTVAVAMSYDPPAYVANFAESRKLPFGVAIDNSGEIAGKFGQVQLTPTSFLINKRGEIVKRYVGAPDFAEFHALVDKLLAEPA